MANDIVINVKAHDQASSVIGGVETKARGLGGVLQGVGTIAGGFLAANVVQSGITAFTGFLSDSTAAARESMQVQAQLNAVIKSTGGVAGVSATQATELASAIEKLSLFEDEAILSGENLLLTFTNIGSETFPRATQAMVDMSQALGQDLSSSAVQLGKALNDPINGITALSRVGVSFTEEQKELIRTMAEAGDIAGAQAVILAELEREFAGSAQAASDAAGSQEVYKDKMNDLSEQIGAKMIPIQEKLNEAKLALATLIADKVIPMLEELYAKHWPAVSAAIQDVVAIVEEWWPKLQPIFAFFFEHAKTQIEGFVQRFQGMVEMIRGVIALVDALFHGEWSAAWEALKQIAGGALTFIEGTIKGVFGNIPEIILGLAEDGYNAAWQFGQELFRGVMEWVESLPGELLALGRQAAASFLQGLYEQLPGWAQDALGTLGGALPGGPGLDDYYAGQNANGTSSWRGGMTWVGEKGPELVKLPGGSQIFNADESRSMGRGGQGVQITINGNVYARDEDDARRSMGNIAYGLQLAASMRGVSI